jgi:hypothetical protein
MNHEPLYRRFLPDAYLIISKMARTPSLLNFLLVRYEACMRDEKGLLTCALRWSAAKQVGSLIRCFLAAAMSSGRESIHSEDHQNLQRSYDHA